MPMFKNGCPGYECIVILVFRHFVEIDKEAFQNEL